MRICGQPCKPSQKHFLNLKSFDGLFTNYFLHLTYSYRPGARHFVQMDEPEQVARLRLEAWGVLVKPKSGLRRGRKVIVCARARCTGFRVRNCVYVSLNALLYKDA